VRQDQPGETPIVGLSIDRPGAAFQGEESFEDGLEGHGGGRVSVAGMAGGPGRQGGVFLFDPLPPGVVLFALQQEIPVQLIGQRFDVLRPHARAELALEHGLNHGRRGDPVEAADDEIGRNGQG